MRVSSQGLGQRRQLLICVVHGLDVGSRRSACNLDKDKHIETNASGHRATVLGSNCQIAGESARRNNSSECSITTVQLSTLCHEAKASQFQSNLWCRYQLRDRTSLADPRHTVDTGDPRSRFQGMVDSYVIMESTYQHCSCQRTDLSLSMTWEEEGSGFGKLSERATGAWNRCDA